MKVLGAEWVATAAGPRDFPQLPLDQVAFAGRSNVGKSSLLNRLVGRRSLARTSNTPGKTRLIHFFQVRKPRGTLLLVDLPGYGYAKVSKKERQSWKSLVESYLGSGDRLRLLVLLLDIRREAGPEEEDLLRWLEEHGIPALVVLTKVDKLPPMQRARRIRELSGSLGVASEHLAATSATKGLGIRELWSAIEARLGESAED